MLRLMVECGEPSEAALKRLRKVRICAVETEEQMNWALAPARRARGFLSQGGGAAAISTGRWVLRGCT